MQTITPEQFRAQSGKRTGKAHGVHRAGEMNKTEQAYALLLEAQKRTGVIVDYWFEAVTLKLAHDLRLTVDFFVFASNGELHAIDVKGAKKFIQKNGPAVTGARIEEDARCKLLVAANKFPFRFFVAYQDNGSWVTKEVPAE